MSKISMAKILSVEETREEEVDGGGGGTEDRDGKRMEGDGKIERTREGEKWHFVGERE